MTNAEAESKRILKFVISRDALRSLLNAGLLDKEQFERALERVAARYQIDPLTGMALESKKGSVWSRAEIDARLLEYENLTEEIRRIEGKEQPTSAIITWLRSRGTIGFLRLWELKSNSKFDDNACCKLVEEMKSSNMTLTPKVWCERTNAIGLLTLRGNGGGTYAHPQIACDFKMWLEPLYRLTVLETFPGLRAKEDRAK